MSNQVNAYVDPVIAIVSIIYDRSIWHSCIMHVSTEFSTEVPNACLITSYLRELFLLFNDFLNDLLHNFFGFTSTTVCSAPRSLQLEFLLGIWNAFFFTLACNFLLLADDPAIPFGVESTPSFDDGLVGAFFQFLVELIKFTRVLPEVAADLFLLFFR